MAQAMVADGGAKGLHEDSGNQHAEPAGANGVDAPHGHGVDDEEDLAEEVGGEPDAGGDARALREEEPGGRAVDERVPAPVDGAVAVCVRQDAEDLQAARKARTPAPVRIA